MSKKPNKVLDALAKGAAATATAERPIVTADQAVLLAKIGQSSAGANDVARRLVDAYLDNVLEADGEISEEDARAAYNILQVSSVLGAKNRCDRVITRYINQLNAQAQKPAGQEA